MQPFCNPTPGASGGASFGGRMRPARSRLTSFATFFASHFEGTKRLFGGIQLETGWIASSFRNSTSEELQPHEETDYQTSL